MMAKFSESIRGLTARPEIRIGAAVFLVAMIFAAYTRHGWEDYWITFRASKNLAMGQGLVFTPGERLHTFTSPLGVLLPAGLSWLAGNNSDALVFWLFRAVSATALAAGIMLLFQSLKKYYELAQVFDASEQIRNIAWLPGRSYLQFDQTFYVFHRKTDVESK